jgi:hypothetical protein
MWEDKSQECSFCGLNKFEDPWKHIAEIAKFLQKQIKECQKILK